MNIPLVRGGLASCCGLLLAAFASGNTGVTVAPDLSTESSTPISSDFVGISFEKSYLEPSHDSLWTGYMFDTNTTTSPNCQQVQYLFRNMNVNNLRIAGGTVEDETYGTSYTSAAVDALFGFGTKIAFAGQTGLKYVYGLRLQANSTNSAPLASTLAEAAYVWGNTGYRGALDCFSLGNESNFHSYHTYAGHTVDPTIAETTTGANAPGTAYPSFAHNATGEWKKFANSIVGSSASGATFGGPDTGDEAASTTTWWNNGTSNISWTQALVADRASGNITTALLEAHQHNYPGGGTAAEGTATQAIKDMLSAAWSNPSTGKYETLWSGILTHVAVDSGWHFRMTEANEYTVSSSTYDGTGACDRYAGAVWVLDYLNWWAWKSAKTFGVNFHSKAGNSTSPIAISGGAFTANPRWAGFKMFYLGSHDGAGNALSKIGTCPITVNPNSANLTAYAMAGAHDLYVTFLNKTSSQAGDASVLDLTVQPTGISTATSASYIVMQSAGSGGTSDATATSSTVGGAGISNSALWSGTWTTGLAVTSAGKCTVTGVHSVNAVIVHISY